MHKLFFDTWLHQEPETVPDKYIFLLDNQGISENLLRNSFRNVCLQDKDGYFSSVESLLDYMGETAYSGDWRSSYTFVPCLTTKKGNDELKEYFKKEDIPVREGWRLFKGKDYLEKPESSEDVKGIVQKFIDDYEKPVVHEESGYDLTGILAKLEADKRYPTNDKGYGRLYADVFRQKHRYNPKVKDYMVYDGKRWTEDTESMSARKDAQVLSDNLVLYALQVATDEDRAYLKAVSKLCERKHRETMINDAKPIYPFNSEDMDKDDYLLNVQNGTLQFTEEKVILKDHDPEDILSKICNVSYDPEAQCPRWKKFLSEVMEDDETKIQYLQKIMGLSLTGNTENESCFILWGRTTRNGKSTFCETMIHLLGDYAMTISPETLATKSNYDSKQASGDIARLAGCRFVNASEPKKKMILDTALLKTLTGRDSITARHLYQREFSFKPKFKFLMNTNHLPQISDDTVFSSGRINVITFDRHFTEAEQDRKLKEKLRDPEEMAGILNWCIEGFYLYQKEGLATPEAVRRSTEDYRQDSDKVGNFISECLEKTGNNTKAKDVYNYYSKWCDDNGYGCENKGNFFADLKAKGIFGKTGTVMGKTVKNIVKGYEVPSEWIKADGSEPF